VLLRRPRLAQLPQFDSEDFLTGGLFRVSDWLRGFINPKPNVVKTKLSPAVW
jgi:hypothetical protein